MINVKNEPKHTQFSLRSGFFSLSSVDFLQKNITFALGFVPPRERIKRESGENPGQSRCCKPPFISQTPKSLGRCRMYPLGRRLDCTAVSQKTCKTYREV